MHHDFAWYSSMFVPKLFPAFRVRHSHTWGSGDAVARVIVLNENYPIVSDKPTALTGNGRIMCGVEV